MPRKRTAAPTFIEPMAALAVQELPQGPTWLYEVKWDGYRALILKNGKDVEIRSRNNKNLSVDHPGIVAAARRLHAENATIDGEIVAVDGSGRPSFQALQHRRAQAGHTVVYYAFDVLHIDGEDLTALPLSARRPRLPPLLKGTGLLSSDPLPGTAAQVTEAIGRLGLEGVIAKRTDSRYDAGQRSGAWVKLKLDRQQEFVVGGYRPGAHGVDAVLVGVYSGRSLMFAGKVRAGFTPHLRREVSEKLKPLQTARCPFANLPMEKSGRWGSGVTAEDMLEMTWVKPALVVQIRFVEWTAESQLRHAAILGIRGDKTVDSVHRET